VADPGYRDVTCSFCGRHNRQVHMVEGRDGLRICQVCVAAAAESIDTDAGVPSPAGGWSTRWSLKT
jgi:ClpX C4-type zinc finger